MDDLVTGRSAEPALLKQIGHRRRTPAPLRGLLVGRARSPSPALALPAAQLASHPVPPGHRATPTAGRRRAAPPE
ncbi:hypothetical protein BC739_005449 [Kutzneria viridogrisea]|uniref:Uncharacterized protein n=1 Tax=Kutzneria viridogrisea TaxID=47990 RepID=A0ABR6BMW8_9PSEU|nr:hypothetical protein [Kutzneria viridogrisea]